VLALRPREVVDDVVHGSLVDATAGDRQFGVVASFVIVEPAEENKRLAVVIADAADALPGEAPVKVVDQRRFQHSRVASA